MEANAIRDAMHAQPFQPFTFRLADGRSITVPHPDFISISGNGRRVAVFGQDESFSILEPLLIVSIEYPSPSPGTVNPSGNGG